MINQTPAVIPKSQGLRFPKAGIFNFFDGLDTGWNDWYGNGTISQDSSVFIDGAASIKIVCSNGAELCGARNNIADIDLTDNDFKIYVKCTDWSQITDAQILFSTSGTFDAFFYTNLMLHLTGMANDEWIEVNLSQADFSASGAADWATVNDVIFKTAATAGNTPTVWFDALGAYTQGSVAKISIVFDDGWDSQYTLAKPVLEKHGLVGSCFVIPELLGTAGYMTKDQVDELDRRGWDICGHGQTNLTTLSATEVEAHARRVKDFLYKNGYRGQEFYAYPNGGFSQAVKTEIKKWFSAARTICDFVNPTRNFDPTALHALSVPNVMSVATVQGRIDTAVAEGGWLILVFHKLVVTPTVDTEYAIADFETIVDYIINTKATAILPLSEVVRTLPNS